MDFFSSIFAVMCDEGVHQIPVLAPDRITYLQRLVDALESPEPFTGTLQGSEMSWNWRTFFRVRILTLYVIIGDE